MENESWETLCNAWDDKYPENPFRARSMKLIPKTLDTSEQTAERYVVIGAKVGFDPLPDELRYVGRRT